MGSESRFHAHQPSLVHAATRVLPSTIAAEKIAASLIAGSSRLPNCQLNSCVLCRVSCGGICGKRGEMYLIFFRECVLNVWYEIWDVFNIRDKGACNVKRDYEAGWWGVGGQLTGEETWPELAKVQGKLYMYLL